MFNSKVTTWISDEPFYSLRHVLSFPEYKISICNEIIEFAKQTGESGVELVKKYQEPLLNYVNNLTSEWDELNSIVDELVKKKPEDIVGTIITLNKRNLITRYWSDKYEFMYALGYEPYKDEYKYGYIAANQVKNTLEVADKKILFSKSSNLLDLFDFQSYFNNLVKEIEDASNLKELNSIKHINEGKLFSIFNVNRFNELLDMQDQYFTEIYGQTPFNFYGQLKTAYFYQFIKLQLLHNGTKQVTNTLAALIQAERYVRGLIGSKDETIEDFGKDWYDNHLSELEDDKLKLMGEVAIDDDKLKELYDSIDWSYLNKDMD